MWSKHRHTSGVCKLDLVSLKRTNKKIYITRKQLKNSKNVWRDFFANCIKKGFKRRQNMYEIDVELTKAILIDYRILRVTVLRDD